MVDASAMKTFTVPEIKPLDQYDFNRAKICASVRWLLAKSYGSAGRFIELLSVCLCRQSLYRCPHNGTKGRRCFAWAGQLIMHHSRWGIELKLHLSTLFSAEGEPPAVISQATSISGKDCPDALTICYQSISLHRSLLRRNYDKLITLKWEFLSCSKHMELLHYVTSTALQQSLLSVVRLYARRWYDHETRFDKDIRFWKHGKHVSLM